MTPTEYVQLCKDLRELGATSVEAEGFKATFPAAVRLVPAEPPKSVKELFLPSPPEGVTVRAPGEDLTPVEAARMRRAKTAEGLFGG